MSAQTEKKLFHRAFELGIALKGLNGVVQTLVGILLLLVPHAVTNGFLSALIQWEHRADVHHFLAYPMLHLGQWMATGSRLLAAAYLLGHGVIKIVIVVALLEKRPWAYRGAIVLLSLFVGFQLYWLGFSFSTTLFLLTSLDIVVIWLVWHEYRAVIRKRL